MMAATHPGDERYKPAAQQAELDVPLPNTEGADQTISFCAMPDQKVGADPATSSANVPVSYFLRQGPGQLDCHKLTLIHIPPSAKFPVKVTVFLWQYGRATEHVLKSAEPVERSFMILEGETK
jgi:hypothetical protein